MSVKFWFRSFLFVTVLDVTGPGLDDLLDGTMTIWMDIDSRSEFMNHAVALRQQPDRTR